MAARRAPAVPAIFAVQAEHCAPLAGLVPTGEPTLATGMAVAQLPRAGQVLEAVIASEGRVLTVSDDQILVARDDLVRRGIAVEPTGAASWAAWMNPPPETGEPAVVVLSGR